MFGSGQRSISPAKVAGVKSVVACTPPVKVSGHCPATINAMKQAGADRICVLGGVPAMALMAFGMGEIERVDILCGSGNKFVAGAKRQLFGQCGIDLLAGPNRIAVIADDSADPALVACDLLGQAEHDPASGQPCVCQSATFGRAVREKIARQRPKLPTGEITGQSWQAIGKLTVAADRQEAIRISGADAPEHLELHVREPDYYFERPRNYASLFIGEETTVAYGEKKYRDQSHFAHEPFDALHRRGVGREVPEDRHLPAHDPGEEPPGRRRHRPALRRRAHGRPCRHGPRARGALRRETARP